MKTPLVSLRCVSVSYDGHDALKEVDLDIYPDDFLGIIGPNGGGKTTLVKAIVGTIPAVRSPIRRSCFGERSG